MLSAYPGPDRPPRTLSVAITFAVAALILTSGAFALVTPEGKSTLSDGVPTRLIVKFKPSTVTVDRARLRADAATAEAELTRLADVYSVEESRPLFSQASARSAGLGDIYLLDCAAGVDLEAMARDYRNLDIVELAEPDYPLELFDAPNDPLYNQQWHLNNTGQECYVVHRYTGMGNDVLGTYAGTPDADMDVLEVHENPPANASTVIVGVVDTGVDPDHPDLQGMLWENPGEIADNGLDDDHNGYIDDIHGCDALGGDGTVTDLHGHGTHCSGIIAARADNGIGIAGVTQPARIMATRCWPLTVGAAAAGIVYAADNGADVINMSWGGDYPSAIVEEAILYAHARGVVLVAAAGNDATEMYKYPACYPQTISVGASTSDDTMAYFSTYNDQLDFCAPGQAVLSLRASGTDMYGLYGEPLVHVIDDDYYLASGTSMASPNLVAVAAYLRAMSPGLSQDYIKDVLVATADDFVDPWQTGDYLPGWDKYSGYGRVNLASALAADLPEVRAQIDAPLHHAIVGGTVQIVGSADGSDFTGYTLEYGEGEKPIQWTEIASSGSPVTEGVLGVWDASELHGYQVIRLRVGEHNSVCVPVRVANESSLAVTYPQPDEIISGYVPIIGSGTCQDFSRVEVEYGVGTEPSSWTPLGTRTEPLDDEAMAYWLVESTDPGWFTIRVSMYSTSGLEATVSVPVQLVPPFTAPDGWRYTLPGEGATSPTYCDLDRDGQNEIIVGTEAGIVVLNTDGTLQVTDLPPLPSGDFRIVPAVGRLDGDEYEDIVFVNSDGELYGYPSAGSNFTVNLPELPHMYSFIPTMEDEMPIVFLKDINGDGIDEIHYYPGGNLGTDRDGWYFVYNADGTPWSCDLTPSVSYQQCLPADLDGDGIDEVYCYGANLAEFDTCGTMVASLPIVMDGKYLREARSEMSAVDIDNDGKVELILQGDFYEASWGLSNWFIYAFDEGLALKEGWPHSLDISVYYRPTHSTFGDLDADGVPEYVCSYYDVVHSHIRAWHVDGSPFLGTDASRGEFASSENPGSFCQALISDVDDDFRAEVLLTCGPDGFPMTYGVERVTAYNSDGSFVSRFPLVVDKDNTSGPRTRNPLAGDIDGDGNLDIAFISQTDVVVFQNFADRPYHPESSFCPTWRYNRRLNANTIMVAETDPDGDGVASADDNCPYVANSGQEDDDDDGFGDACDNCPNRYNPGQEDADGTGPGDLCCCVGSVGDANQSGDEDPTIGDVSVLIDHLFINQAPLGCPAEADINQSGGANPSQGPGGDITIGDISLLIDYLFISQKSFDLGACQ